MTSRSQIWDGAVWVDLTGGADIAFLDTLYLRLDGSNQMTGGLTINTGFLSIVRDNSGFLVFERTSIDLRYSMQLSSGRILNEVGPVAGPSTVAFEFAPTGFRTLVPLEVNNGTWITAYNPTPPLYGGGDTFWYQGRNIRFKDSAGPPGDAEGVDGDVCLMYSF